MLALTDATVTTAVTVGITNPVRPRSVVAVVAADGGDVTFVAGNVVVVGTDQFDAAQTETIAIQTGAVADTKFRWTVGTKVFKTITSIRMDTAQPANAKFSVGLGTIFGLRGKLAAAGDVQVVLKNGLVVSSGTYTASATTHSIKMGADITAATDDLIFQYNALASDVIDLEAASGAVIGTVGFVVRGR